MTTTAFAFQTAPVAFVLCLVLVIAGAAIQVAVGAGMSVVCGPLVLIALGPPLGVPLLLALNLLVSVIAALCGGFDVRWSDVALAAAATLVGCALAAILPTLPDAALTVLTALVLLAVALPRPPAPDAKPSARSATIGVGLGGMASGALTVWTATPGPVLPVALARAGRSGAEIRTAMQPISVVGYGVGLAFVGTHAIGTLRTETLAAFVLATLVGTLGGLVLRRWIAPAQVVLLVRIVGGVSAVLLLGSLLRGG